MGFSHRSSFLLPGLALLGAAACARAPEAERLAVRSSAVLLRWANRASGDTVPVMNGGYGSALAVDRAHPGRFYLMSDRGPNYEYGEDSVAFPIPDFSPQIGIFERQGDTLVRTGVVTLKDSACRPLTGRPLPADRPGATGEIGVAVDGTALPGDTNGVDPEGLVALGDGTFWVSDEYGPFLFQVNAEGCTLRRLAPGAANGALPRVLAKRRVNRGFEGLTTPDEGRTLVAMLQAPLDNPKQAGRKSRLVRILQLDTGTGATRQYAYLLEDSDLGVSDILSLGGTRYLVLERDGKFPLEGGSSKRFYTIDLAPASDISDSLDGETGRLADGRTPEELTAEAKDPAAALRSAGIVPVTKRLTADLLEAMPDYAHDKVEGVALVRPGLIAIINDDDFGVADGKGGFVPKTLRGVKPPTADHNEVVLLRLPE